MTEKALTTRQKAINQKARIIARAMTGNDMAADLALSGAKGFFGTGAGALETGTNIAQFFAPNSQPIKSFKGKLAQTQQDIDALNADVNPVSSFIGENVANPVNYIPIGKGKQVVEAMKGAPKAAKVGRMFLEGLKVGTASGLTTGTGKADSDILDTAGNVALQGTVGGVTGAAIPVLGQIGNLAYKGTKGAGNRIAAMFGSTGAKQNIARDILAGRAMNDKITPQMMIDASQSASQNDLGQTLGETLASPSLLQGERNVARGTGEGARIMQDHLVDRSKSTIPTRIQGMVQQLRKGGENADDLYKAAAAESNAKQDAVKAAMADQVNQVPSNLPLNFGEAQGQGSKTLYDIGEQINKRLSEVGNVTDDLEVQTLNKIKSRIDNASSRGETFEALLDAKKQIAKLYNDVNPQAIADVNRYVAPFTTKIDNALDAMAGNGGVYQEAKDAAMQNMAARDLTDALGSTREGGIAQLYNKLWADPEAKADFIRKLTPEQRPQFEAMFDEMSKVARGHGGQSATIPTGGGGSSLDREISGADFISPLRWWDKAGESVGNLFTGDVRSEIANMAINRDPSIMQTMVRKGRSVLDNTGLMDAAAYGSLTGAQAVKPNMQVTPDQQQQSGEIPPLPEGFMLEEPPQDVPPLPEGFTLEQQPQASVGGSLMDRIAMAESSGNPNAKASTSSASGLFQFTDGTWNDMVAKYGQQYGITPDMKNDPQAQRIMAEMLAQENAQMIEQNTGEQPSDGDIYLAHFLGGQGASELIKALGTGAPAAQLFPAAAKSNQALFFEDGRPVSVERLYQRVTGKVQEV